MTMTQADTRGAAFEICRAELVNYATRMVARHDIAEEIVQDAALRLLQRDTPLASEADVRPWLFRVVSHLAVCFACTLRNLSPEQAAALLLKEVHGFSTAEIAETLGSSPTQIKNRLQQARRTLEDRYAHTCALVSKKGVCHQCVELDGFFNDRRRDPLDGTPRDLDARLAILRETREQALGPWHRRMMRLIDDVL